MTRLNLIYVVLTLSFFAATLSMAEERPKSPPGQASTQIGDAWIDIHYSRPILRGRHGIFGTGEDYGQTVRGRAEYWRVGANATTKIKTTVDLEVGGQRIPAGEYGIVVGLAEDAWTLVLTSQQRMETYTGREDIKKGIMWGSYGYKPDNDVARAKMEVGSLEHSMDQMTISFLDVDEEGATLAIAWDKTMATTRLKVAK